MTNSGPPASPALREGVELELAFRDLLANGQGVGRSGGMVVFCFGPLPGEVARVRITQVKQKYAVAEMVTLRSPSRYRVKPFCPVFGTCGGCQVQHFSYPAQLAWKQDVVKNALQRIGGFADVKVRAPIGMIHPRNYRNKMSLVVDHRNGQTLLGFYKQRSHVIVPIDECPIVEPALNQIIARLVTMARTSAMQTIFSQVRHAVARFGRASERAIITLTTRQQSRELQANGAALLAQIPLAAGLSNSYDPGSENVVLGRKQIVLAGSQHVEEQIHGVRYRVSAASFFQVNREIVGRILAFMEPGLRQPRNIVDLYCGAGTFSLFFAKLGSTVLGIEENATAIAEARENAVLNGMSAAEFLAARVEEYVASPQGQGRLRDCDIVFLDPPRKGSDEQTLGSIATAAVRHVWYLSCDPATLARDLKFLAAKGYRLGVVQPFDMFPQTGHVETLVTLYREASDEQSLQAEQTVEAFAGAPIPEWPLDDEYAYNQPEYPEFVVR